MKTTSAPPAPRYRNDAVFRSAQRLLATPPPKRPAARPAWWLMFLLGLVLGAILAPVGWKYWRASPADLPLSGSSLARADRAQTTGPKAARNEPRAPAETAAISSAAAAAATEDSPLALAENAVSRRILAAGSFITPAEFATAIPNASRAPGEWTTSPVLTLTLGGELQHDRAKPIECEFVLRRAADGKSSTVSGIIRFLSGEQRLAAYSLIGTFEDHTMRLRDSDTIWTLRDLINPLLKPSAAPAGHREFELHFPLDRNAAEITGTWKIDNQGGTLSLHPATPW